MLELAIVHKDEIQKEFINTVYNEKYKFYNFGSYYNKSDFKVNEEDIGWSSIEFASVKDGKVLGFISASVSQNNSYYSGLKIINFSENKVTFGKDVVKFIDMLFKREDLHKLCFSVAVGNPIESTYDKLTKKYGGRIVGTYKKHVRLFDGKLYDKKVYEITREEYINSKSINNRGSDMT